MVAYKSCNELYMHDHDDDRLIVMMMEVIFSRVTIDYCRIKIGGPQR